MTKSSIVQATQLTFFFGILLGLIACSSNEDPLTKEAEEVVQQPKTEPLFRLLTEQESGFHFINELKEDEKLNVLKYPYLYNGSGVAIGVGAGNIDQSNQGRL